MSVLRLLILGGTGEARELARRVGLRFRGHVDPTYSIAGKTDTPRLPPCNIRRGGFGGASGLAAHLRDGNYDAVIDATHPFAERISNNVAAACTATGTPLFKVGRTPWQQHAADNWFEVDGIKAAASRLATGPWRRAFLTTGHTSLEAFSKVRDIFFLVRLFTPPASPLPFTDVRLVVDQGPFTVDAETTIMCDNDIDVLVTKASGGSATQAKLTAARALGLPVIMLRRPTGDAAERLNGVDEALIWLGQRLRERRNAESRKCIVDAPHLAGQDRGT